MKLVFSLIVCFDNTVKYKNNPHCCDAHEYDNSHFYADFR